MALQAPSLPQSVNGNITTGIISADQGIIVDIPSYGNLVIGDTIRIYFNTALVATDVIVTLTQLPKRYTIPGNNITIGSNTLYYTSTDDSGNTSTSNPLPFRVIESASVSGYMLTSVISVNNANADGSAQNQITYILTSTTGQPVAGQFITFAVYSSGGAHLSAPFGMTNSAGIFILYVTNNIAENVLIVATLSSDSTVTNSQVVNFVEAPIHYSLTTSVVINNSPANGKASNRVTARLVNSVTQAGIGGRVLSVYVGGAATYPNTVITNPAGEADIFIQTINPGSLTVIVTLQSDFTVQSMTIVDFVASYPITLGTYEKWLGYNVPIAELLGPFFLQEGHTYEYRNTRAPNGFYNCPIPNALIYSGNATACVLGRGNDFEFLDNQIHFFKPKRTSVGASMYSQRYPFYSVDNTGYGLITLIDYGPATAAISLPPQSVSNGGIPFAATEETTLPEQAESSHSEGAEGSATDDCGCNHKE